MSLRTVLVLILAGWISAGCDVSQKKPETRATGDASGSIDASHGGRRLLGRGIEPQRQIRI